MLPKIKTFVVPLSLISLFLSTTLLSVYMSVRLNNLLGLPFLLNIIGWCLFMAFDKANKCKHVVLLLLDVLLLFIYGLAALYFIYDYNNLTHHLDPFVQLLLSKLTALLAFNGQSVQANTLLTVNMVALFFMCFIRLMAVTMLKKVNNDDIFYPLYHIAYAQAQTKTENNLWCMKPWLSYAKWLSVGLFLLSILLFLYYWDVSFSPNKATSWLAWFGALFVIVAIDWFHWFNGIVATEVVPEDDDNETPSPKTNDILFEELWKRYHLFWKDKWLVAGNKSTNGKKNAK